MKRGKRNNSIQNLKIMTGVSIVLLLLILIVSLFFIVDDASRSVTIRFMVAPSSARITLNGTEYQSAETYKIAPDEYELLIEREGFKPYRKTLSPNEDDVLNINVALEVLPGNEDYYKNHPDEAYALETIWTNQMEASSEAVFGKNPLIGILPIEVEYYIQGKQYVHYQISFKVDTSNKVTILINDYTGGNHASALNRIRDEGYNPDDYSIEYRDLSNEFTDTDNF